MAVSKPLQFLETFNFVEPKTKQKTLVPNHLLESKIYAKIQQNASIKASPAVIHFGGFEIGKTQRTVVSICNVAREIVRLHIIPPQTDAFSIKYTKPDRLVPGMTMSCYIEFTGDEYRYYYDTIKIHCPSEDNIIIPIHAYPILDTSGFPTQLKFPMTAIGDRKTHTVSLSSHVDADFEFQLSMLKEDEAFEVVPMSGVIPANQSTIITINYQPLNFCTSTMKLQLDTSQFDFTSIVCTVTGSCQPGVKALKESTETSIPQKEKRVYSPLEKMRQKKKQSVEKEQKSKTVIDGIRIPERIDTVHHLSNVLLQVPGKLTLKELIEAEKSVSGRQMKESRFEQAVRKNVYEERQNQLRWQVRLGDSAITAMDRERVTAERQNSWTIYKAIRGDPVAKDELKRKSTESLWKRTTRAVSQLADEGIQFDLYSNNPWSTRHNATDRFAQAARKIILRNRATKSLSRLDAFIKNWNKKQKLLSSPDYGQGKDGKTVHRVPVIESDDETGSLANALSLHFSPANVIHTKYPVFVPPNKKDELAPDALSEVVTYETQIDMEEKTPYFHLLVPQQSRLLGYNEHEIHLGYDYVEPELAKDLRSGAQEEIVSLVKPHEAIAKPDEVVLKNAPPTAGTAKPGKEKVKISINKMRIEDITKDEMDSDNITVGELVPPESMFMPVDYPPLHIFNPTPGLQVFQAPVSYAEVDPDYHLCPLPRYIVHANDPSNHKQTQKQFLDRQDVIKGTMSWKKFPSQGLTSLANTPTLTNVWVPRWSDPFSNDLLPLEAPEIQSGLAESDILEYGDNDGDGADLHLTPEMVKAQFDTLSESRTTEDRQLNSEAFPLDNRMPVTSLPVSDHGPIPREKREQELDHYLSKRSNRLGQKIKSKVEHLSSLCTRTDLLLN